MVQLRVQTSWSRQLAGAVTVLIVACAFDASGGPALAGASQRRAAMLAFGVDMMPVGTAAGVERAKRVRFMRP